MKSWDLVRSKPYLIIALLFCLITGSLIGYDIRLSIYIIGMISLAGFVILCFIKPFYAFCGLILLGLTVWISSIQLVGGISLMVGVGGVFLGTWLVRLLTKNVTFVTIKEFWYLAGLAITVVISTLLNWGRSAGFAPAFTYIQLLLLMVLIINFTMTPFHLHQLGYVFIISSMLMAGVVLLSHFGVLPAGLVKTEEGSIYLEGTYQVFDRSAGVFGDPNFTALQLIVALPFILEFFRNASLWLKFALLFSAVMILMALSYTYSLGGMVGLATILLLKTFFVGRRNIIVLILQIALAGFIGWWLVLSFLPEYYWTRILININMIGGFLKNLDFRTFLSLGTTRGDTWTAAFKTFSRSPVWGHGPGNSVYLNPSNSVFYFNRLSLGAHNFLLTIAGDLGVIGLLMVISLLLFALRASWPNHHIDSNLELIRNAVFIALVSSVVQGIAIDMQSQKLLWVLLGMALVIKRLSIITRREEQLPPKACIDYS